MVVVRLHYGQYRACDIVRYRTQRLFGLTKELSQDGYDVELIPSQHWDRLEIEISGRIIFRCRLSYLEFNCEANEDPLAMKAVRAVRDVMNRLNIRVPHAPPVGKITAKAGQVSLIQRNMITIIDACSILEDIDASNRATTIRTLVESSEKLEKISLDTVKEECVEWKKEVSEDDIGIHELLDSIIESAMIISDNWKIVEPLLKHKCESCSECIPYCRCSVSTISAESLKEACSVCGPYCVCKKIPSSELIKLCRKCGSKTCICSSSSEGSVEICNVVIKPPKVDEKTDPKHVVRTNSNIFCDNCEFICTDSQAPLTKFSTKESEIFGEENVFDYVMRGVDLQTPQYYANVPYTEEQPSEWGN